MEWKLRDRITLIPRTTSTIHCPNLTRHSHNHRDKRVKKFYKFI